MNPEKRYFDKTVGAAPEEQEEFERRLAEQIEEIGGSRLEELEVPKTAEELQMLTEADAAAQRYLRKYGRAKDLAVLSDNVHVLRQGALAELLSKVHANPERQARVAHAEALAIPTLGAVYIERQDSLLQFALGAFHEFYHLRGYRAFQLTKDRQVDVYRSGFSVRARDGSTKYFHYVEEALTAYVERQFYEEELSNHPAVRAEVADLKEKGEEPPFAYPGEVRKFERLVDMLWNANKGDYPAREDVIRLFLESQATGNLLKVARLVEHTFGHGSFRLMGERTADKK